MKKLTTNNIIARIMKNSKVLKSHKVLLCKHSRNVPHVWASPHVSPNVQMYCCLKEESIPIFSQYSNVPFSEKDRKVYLSCLL